MNREVTRARRTALVAALWVALSIGGASADVTITGATSGTGRGLMAQGDSTVLVKGLKMRSDVVVRGEASSSIVELDRERFVSLDHGARQAVVYDLRAFAGHVQAIADRDVTVVLTATGRAQDLLGQRCIEHTVDARVAESGARVALSIRGQVWIAPDSPGRADWARFYEAASAKGLFFTDPRAAQVNPARAKAMTALYRQIATIGVPYSTELEVAFQGTGARADQARRAGPTTVASRVTAVATEPVSDETFAVPAAYTVTGK